MANASQMLNEPSDALLEALKAQLGPKGWLAPNDRYLTERRGLYRGQAAIILRPSSTAEVAACVRLCAEARVGIIPWGGGTGLVGGQISIDGPIPVVLALDRMRAIRAIAPSERALTVEAGLPVEAVQQAAEKEGLLFPLAYGSQGTASIGGGLATNAGGMQAIRYGVARDQCLGLEVVTARGEVWDGLSTLRKDNTGYDLRDLFIGSEGTLGIITAASLRLVSRPRARVAGFIGVSTPTAAIKVMNALQAASGDALAVCELMSEFSVALALRADTQMRAPLQNGYVWSLLIELWGADETSLTSALEDVLSTALDAREASDAVIAQSEGQRLAFRALRESIAEAQKLAGASIKHDISLPIGAIPEFLDAGAALIERLVPGARLCPFGHLGDGNLHYNITQPPEADPEAFLAEWSRVNEAVHDLTERFGGSISAEHGIGRLKRSELSNRAPAAKMGMLGAIKASLDPLGILNPGAVL